MLIFLSVQGIIVSACILIFSKVSSANGNDKTFAFDPQQGAIA